MKWTICRGGALIGTALWSLGCSSSEPGIEVALQYEAVGIEAQSPIVVKGGVTVMVERAQLAVRSFELVACESSASIARQRTKVLPESMALPGSIPWRRLPGWTLQALRPSRARAHHTDATAATRLQRTRIFDFRGSAVPSVPDILRPPPASYCTVKLILGPVDETADDVAYDSPLRGLTLHFAAASTSQTAGAGRTSSVEVSTALQQTVELPLAPALRLSSTQRSAKLRIESDFRQWVEAGDFTSPQADDLSSTVLARAAASLQVVLE